ncbi:tyrosine-type recombinase/integrase [Deinococcus ruber]|uniref:Site-specific integrase n=1 Tax=Deinococcus ruber TaxID=1848197 RepID=A0A918FE93_9DEIO|nr:site-specific integrase [Deinococcus ruber]GGR27536.1 site-specific integrase [Deinococcus ruber]
MKRRTNGQGSIRQLPSGTYRWQITLGFDQDGKQILKYGVAESRVLAERAKSQAIADRDRGLLPMPNRITLNDWLPKWLDGKELNLAPKTIANYRYLTQRHLKPLLGEKRLQDLKPSDVRSAYHTLVQQGFPRSLLHQVRVILKGALQDALLDEIVSRNVAEIVHLPSFKRTKTARALSPEEARQFLATAHKQRLGVLFEFVIATGLRRGEVCARQWSHLDLDAGVVRVRENLTVVNGKATLGAPKTESGVRDLHLAPETTRLLRQHQMRQADELTLPTAYVFTNRAGERLYPDSLTKSSGRIASSAGLGHVRFHDLRHTYASLMLSQGVPMEVVSEKLGHSRPSTTADIYRHIYLEEHERHTIALTKLLTPLPLKLRPASAPAIRGRQDDQVA